MKKLISIIEQIENLNQKIKGFKDGLNLDIVRKKFPWVLNADIKDAVLGMKNNKLVWYNGIWQDGYWYSGIWLNGIWKNGNWNSGIWKNGTWYNGDWKFGYWYNGTWKMGFWYGGEWHGGKWIGGYSYN